jgi:hypothetical protein
VGEGDHRAAAHHHGQHRMDHRLHQFPASVGSSSTCRRMPSAPPEISTKATVVNFAVKKDGLEAQLPYEYSLFVTVNSEFLKVMENLFRNPNARRSCLADGLLNTISGMDEGLERIQESLDQYLETKRMVFPRGDRHESQKVENCALGQGQAPTAVRMIEEGAIQGNWVFLANCRLMLSWMPTLEKMIDSLVEGNLNPKFRLWLSSSPDPQFPIAILQRGIKMTTSRPRACAPTCSRCTTPSVRSSSRALQPPVHLQAPLVLAHVVPCHPTPSVRSSSRAAATSPPTSASCSRSCGSTPSNTISEEQFARCSHQSTYKRLLFSLVWFHAIQHHQ